MPKLGDWVLENTSTATNGPLVLTGAVTGFNTFSSILADAEEVYYSIEENGDKETGIGTYILATNTLTRVPTATYVSGVYDDSSPIPITLTGSAIVGCAVSAQAYNAIDALKSDITHTHSAISGTFTTLKDSSLLLNQFFNTDTIWTKGSEWSITGGEAIHTAGAAISLLSQSITVTTSDVLHLQYTISNYTAGTITPKLIGGVPIIGTSRSANGTYIEELIVNGNTDFAFEAALDFAGTIDTIILKKKISLTISNGIVTSLS